MFRKRGKTPHDLVSHLVKHLKAVLGFEANGTAAPGVTRGSKHHHESLLHYLTEVQSALYGSTDAEPNREIVAQLCRALLSDHDSPSAAVAGLAPLTFMQAAVAALPLLYDEECGILTQVICFFFRATAAGAPEHPAAIAHLRAPFDLADLGLSRAVVGLPDDLPCSGVSLLLAYNVEGRAPALLLNASRCLHDALRFSAVAGELLEINAPVRFLQQLLSPSFDVSSSASTCLTDLVAGNRASDDPAWHSQVAEWLINHYDDFFSNVTRVLESVDTNYLACREMLRLIGALLFVSANKCVIVRWVSEVENLKLMMRLLVNKNSFIQLEAFHLFKLFVANPRKPPAISRILVKNRDKLLAFFETFAPTRESHKEDFLKERNLVISIIRDLKTPPAAGQGDKAPESLSSPTD